jgi:hypothetical protein
VGCDEHHGWPHRPCWPLVAVKAALCTHAFAQQAMYCLALVGCSVLTQDDLRHGRSSVKSAYSPEHVRPRHACWLFTAVHRCTQGLAVKPQPPCSLIKQPVLLPNGCSRTNGKVINMSTANTKGVGLPGTVMIRQHAASPLKQFSSKGWLVYKLLEPLHPYSSIDQMLLPPLAIMRT